MNPVVVYSCMHNAVGGLLHLQYFYCTEYLPLSPRGIRCYVVKKKDRDFDAHGVNALEHVLVQGLRVQNDSLRQQLSRCGQ